MSQTSKVRKIYRLAAIVKKIITTACYNGKDTLDVIFGIGNIGHRMDYRLDLFDYTMFLVELKILSSMWSWNYAAMRDLVIMNGIHNIKLS